MHYQTGASKGGNARERAAVFVDFDNIFSQVYGRNSPRIRPGVLISELLDGVRDHLNREFRAVASLMAAYADFSGNHSGGQDIKRSLYLQGVESRFVPASMQRNAAELQLCVDVVESLYTHPDIRIVVIVTGDRPYLPLIQHSMRSGRRPVVIMLWPSENQRHAGGDHVIVSAAQLLRDATVRELDIRPSHGRASYAPAQNRKQSGPMPASRHREITHPGALATLRVIEEHFGQYDEIYLTPLLRKLSEVIGDTEYDPKSLISEIEEAGAVWLEKRKGFPYDYTVLLINPEHPNVAALQMDGYESEPTEQEQDYEHAPQYEVKEYGDDSAAEFQEADYLDEEVFEEEAYSSKDPDDNSSSRY